MIKPFNPQSLSTPGFHSRLTLAWVLLFLALGAATARAQQPFITDDADTTKKGHFHFEFSNEFDLLQRSSFPNRKRIGDTNVSLKYNFLRERENSRRPALAIAFNLELPTGDTKQQLGSGLADFYMNSILQKSVSKNKKLRLNGGILFTGNETTGVVGIKTRGTVFTGGASLVKQFSPKLQLGVELTGALQRNFKLGKGQLQTLAGGNYQFKENVSFDFGLVGGKYSASPRVGVQLGVSVDW